MAGHWPHPWNHSLLAPRPAECTHLLHSRHPVKTALCTQIATRVWTAQKATELTELQGQHHPSSPQIPRLQA